MNPNEIDRLPFLDISKIANNARNNEVLFWSIAEEFREAGLIIN